MDYMRLGPTILVMDSLPKPLEEHGRKFVFLQQAEDAFHGLQGVNPVNRRVETLIVRTSRSRP